MIEFGPADIQRRDLPPEQQKLNNYLLYSRANHISSDSDFNSRSMDLSKRIEILL